MCEFGRVCPGHDKQSHMTPPFQPWWCLNLLAVWCNGSGTAVVGSSRTSRVQGTPRKEQQMTGEFSEDTISRRELMRRTGAAAVVGSALESVRAVAADTSAQPSGGMSAAANEICRMDAVTLAEKIRTKQMSPTEVTEAVLAR